MKPTKVYIGNCVVILQPAKVIWLFPFFVFNMFIPEKRFVVSEQSSRTGWSHREEGSLV